jgi:hypothetical protein
MEPNRELRTLLSEPRFDFLSTADRDFILAFNGEMNCLGYGFGPKIGSGYCWGKYMLIYRKIGVKNDKVYARIYIREPRAALRFFLNDIDAHRPYLEQMPGHIKNVFTGSHGDCQHCHNEKDGSCRFRKEYTLDGRLIQKCNGIVFEFPNPSVQMTEDYMDLFTEFYPLRKSNQNLANR